MKNKDVLHVKKSSQDIPFVLLSFRMSIFSQRNYKNYNVEDAILFLNISTNSFLQNKCTCYLTEVNFITEDTV